MEFYRVKAKPGFNIVVKDLGLSFRSETNWIDVDKERFDASADVRSVRKFLLVEGQDTESEKVATASDNGIVQTNGGAFVREGHVQENPADVFVAQPKTSPEASTTAPIETVPVTKVAEKTEVVETTKEVVEEIVEAKEVIEEVKAEVVEKTTEKAVEAQPVAKKSAARGKTNKKTK